MNCPACGRQLTRFKVGETDLDACHKGCGGVWFDSQELEQVNRAVPAGKTPLAEIVPDPAHKPDPRQTRKCTRCPNTKLQRKLFSLGSGVVIDCCPRCHGIWLDYGELEAIRAETHPRPPKPRHVVSRPRRSVPINFEVIQKVQTLRIHR